MNFRRPQRQYQNHTTEDRIEDQVLALKSRLELIDSLDKIGDPSIKTQNNQQRKEIRAQIHNMTEQFGVSLYDVYGKVGGELLKGQILSEREAQQKRDAEGAPETDTFDLVNEDNVLLQRSLKTNDQIDPKYQSAHQRYNRFAHEGQEPNKNVDYGDLDRDEKGGLGKVAPTNFDKSVIQHKKGQNIPPESDSEEEKKDIQFAQAHGRGDESDTEVIKVERKRRPSEELAKKIKKESKGSLYAIKVPHSRGLKQGDQDVAFQEHTNILKNMQKTRRSEEIARKSKQAAHVLKHLYGQINVQQRHKRHARRQQSPEEQNQKMQGKIIRHSLSPLPTKKQKNLKQQYLKGQGFIPLEEQKGQDFEYELTEQPEEGSQYGDSQNTSKKGQKKDQYIAPTIFKNQKPFIEELKKQGVNFKDQQWTELQNKINKGVSDKKKMIDFTLGSNSKKIVKSAIQQIQYSDLPKNAKKIIINRMLYRYAMSSSSNQREQYKTRWSTQEDIRDALKEAQALVEQ